jgi:hypothetical protein
MRRLLVIAALMLPALLLGGWLIWEQWPIWNAPQPNWLPEGAPGVCAAVASLRVLNAERAGDQAEVTPLEARKLADRLTQHLYDLDAPPAYAEPVLVRADFPNVGRRLAWLYTAALPGERALYARSACPAAPRRSHNASAGAGGLWWAGSCGRCAAGRAAVGAAANAYPQPLALEGLS